MGFVGHSDRWAAAWHLHASVLIICVQTGSLPTALVQEAIRREPTRGHQSRPRGPYRRVRRAFVGRVLQPSLSSPS